MQIKTGLLIAIEGIDGAGKSTLANILARQLIALNHSVILTKEPGGTHLGKQLRDILQTQLYPLDPKAEYLLFAADRAQHFHDIIIPYLEQNNIVISDRMSDSSLVYQGYGRGLDIPTLQTINAWAMNNITPDITIYVRVAYTVARERIMQRNMQLTAFEKEQDIFLQKLVVGFDDLLLSNPHCIVIDGTTTPEIVAITAIEKVLKWITSRTKQ
jgi:dTMP kinase